MNHGNLKLITAKGNITYIPKGTAVKWPSVLDADPLEYFHGRVTGGPYEFSEEEKMQRLGNGWDVGPFHRVKDQNGSLMSIVTSYLELDK